MSIPGPDSIATQSGMPTTRLANSRQSKTFGWLAAEIAGWKPNPYFKRKLLSYIRLVMVKDHFSEEIASEYDVTAQGLSDNDVLGPAVDRLAEWADGGPVLEFGVGTGLRASARCAGD